MKRSRLQLSLATTATAALLLTGCGGGPSDSDRASAEEAALAAVDGAGQVTDTSTGDDDDQYAYEVDIDLENGEDVEVELDEDFGVLNQPELDAELSEAAPSAAQSDDGSTAPEAPASETPAPSRDAASGAPQGADDDTPLTGNVRRQAVQAARAEVGQGRVTEATYTDPDETHVYEVEIDLPSGDDVTVELAEDFSVVRVDR